MRSGRASRPRPSARHRAASYPREVSPFLLKPPSTANCSKSKGDKVWYSAKRPGRSTGRHEIGFPLSRPDRQKRQWRQARDAREVAIKRINMSGIYECQQGWSVRVDWGKRRPAASETKNSFVLSRSGGTPLHPVIVDNCSLRNASGWRTGMLVFARGGCAADDSRLSPARLPGE
jgi:hypothetical protein